MALTFAQPTTLRFAQGYDTPAYDNALQQMELNGASQLERGWESAGYSEQAQGLMARAAELYNVGDVLGGKAYEQNARDVMSRAQQWAPTVQNFTDINGVGSAVDWAGGALGNMRTSVKPALAGLAGGVVGAGVGLLARNPALGIRAGTSVGSFLGGYDSEYNEALSNAMMDQQIRQNKSYQQMIDASRAKGVAAGALESIVPGMLAKSALGQGAKKTLARELGQDALGEFLTEGTQSLTGQAAQNYLKDQNLTNFDYKDAFNEGMAGAVGGGGMALGTHGLNTAWDVTKGGAQKVADFARNPAEKLGDAIADTGSKLGERAGTDKDAEEALRIKEIIGAHVPIMSNEELSLPDDQLHEKAVEMYTRAAQDILSRDPADHGTTRAIREAAAQFLKDKDYTVFNRVVESEARKKKTDGFLSRLLGKQSLMRPTLTDDFGEIEGRDKSEDTVTNDYGDRVRGANRASESGLPYGRTSDESVASGLGKAGITATGLDSRKGATSEGIAANEAVKERANKIRNTLAGVLRNYGVSEKIMDGTAGMKDEDQRRMVGLLEYLESGARDSKEAVPALIEMYGRGAPKLFKKAYDIASHDGLIKRDDAWASGFHKKLEQGADSAHAKREAIHSNLSFSAMANVPHNKIDETIDGLTPYIDQYVKTGSKKLEAALVEHAFGTKENLDAALDAWGKTVDKPEMKYDGNLEDVEGVNDDGELTDGVKPVAADDQSFTEGEPNITSEGRVRIGTGKQKNKPFNLNYQGQAEDFQKKVDQLNEGTGQSARAVGVWTDLKESVGKDELYDHESELINMYIKDVPATGKYGSLVAQAQGLTNPGELSDKQRARLLSMIDKRFKYIVTDNVEENANDTAITDHTRYEAKVKEGEDRPEHGVFYLRTNAGREFPVRTTRFLTPQETKITNAHRDRTDGEQGGARSTHENLMMGVARLMETGKFGNQFGYKDENGKMVWGDKLPDNLIMSKNGETVGDAKKQPLKLEEEKEAFEPRRRNATYQINVGELLDRVYDRLHTLPSDTQVLVSKAIQNYKSLREEDKASAERMLRNLFKRHFGKDVVEAVGTKYDPYKTEEGQVGTGTLADYDPETEIRRDASGQPNSGNLMLDAALMVGSKDTNRSPVKLTEEQKRKLTPRQIEALESSKAGKVDPKDSAPTIDTGLPTAPTDAQIAALNSLETMKDFIVANMRFNLDSLRGSELMREMLGKMSLNQLAFFKDALSEVLKLDSQHMARVYVASTTKVVNKKGKRVEVVTTPSDIAEAKKLQQHLRKNAVMLRALEHARRVTLTNEQKAIAGQNTGGSLTDTRSDTGESRSRDSESKSRSNEQSASSEDAKQDQVEAAKEYIAKVLGNTVELKFEKLAKGSGVWTPGAVKNVIRLSINGDVVGTAYHESVHELFSLLSKHGAENVKALLARVANNPIIMREMERQLKDHPDAKAQLKDAEEAVAYMFQFAQMGLLKVGPETKTLFQRIASILRHIASVFSETVRENLRKEKSEAMQRKMADEILKEFSNGALADKQAHEAIIGAMRQKTEVLDKNIKSIGERWANFTAAAGKLVMSAEAVMDATNNHYISDVARWFHEKAGTAILKHKVTNAVAHGGYLQAVRQGKSYWMNKIETLLEGYDAKDVALAREALAKGDLTSGDKVADEIMEKVKKFYEEMGQYMTNSDVRRLNEESHEWEEVKLRKDYGITQTWNTEFLMNNSAEFRELLLQHHMKELTKIATQASGELARGQAAKGSAAEAAGKDKRKTVTPEDVADAIVQRLLNAGGRADLAETNSHLGITPAATAVNKRELTWLDGDAFDKFKEQDLVKIMTSYANQIVTRAESQKRFGYGGERIRDNFDKAYLYELGGEELVKEAQDKMEVAIAEWKSHGADEGADYPTLRQVGFDLHREQVGLEKHEEALHKATKKLGPSEQAIMAMEGTLGNDISPTARTALSWVTTYQNFRLLGGMLFSSFADVNGIVVNGGEMKDAWNAFVTGIREIRNTWMSQKDKGGLMERGEDWGVVDAGSFLDSLGQAYGSVFMSGKAKEMSDKFFKWTGAEGWNRGIRGVAANVAERMITGWATNGINMDDKAAVARLERLYGEGATTSDIKLDADGRLDIKDEANRAAVQRWVLDSITTPTAANRTIWMSDMHYSLMGHLKNFTYAQHRVILAQAVSQAKLGNYRPVLAAMSGYIPIMIAGGAIKEMLVPGDEPPWMKGGLDGYLQYGWDRAGLLGIPQMYVQGLKDPVSWFGPTADQFQNVLSIPFGEFNTDLPMVGKIGLEDHTILGEGLGALPLGNFLKRAAN